MDSTNLKGEDMKKHEENMKKHVHPCIKEPLKDLRAVQAEVDRVRRELEEQLAIQKTGTEGEADEQQSGRETSAEVALLQEGVDYCKSLLGMAIGVDATKQLLWELEEKEEDLGLALEKANTPSGTVFLGPKSDRKDCFMEPTRKKKGLKNKKGDSKKGSELVKHTAETLSLFDRLKMTPPVSKNDVSSILDKLELRLLEEKKKPSQTSAAVLVEKQKLGGC